MEQGQGQAAAGRGDGDRSSNGNSKSSSSVGGAGAGGSGTLPRGISASDLDVVGASLTPPLPDGDGEGAPERGVASGEATDRRRRLGPAARSSGRSRALAEETVRVFPGGLSNMTCSLFVTDTGGFESENPTIIQPEEVGLFFCCAPLVLGRWWGTRRVLSRLFGFVRLGRLYVAKTGSMIPSSEVRKWATR